MRFFLRFISLLLILFLGKAALCQKQFVFGDTLSLANEKGIISQQLSEGTIWVVGSSRELSGTNLDVVAVRIDTAGNVLSKFNKYGTSDAEYPNNMIYQNGQLIIAGEQHNANGVDGFILIIDSLGNFISFQNYGKIAASEQFFDIEPTADGGFVVSGFSSVGPGNDFLIAKFDAMYQLGWMQTYNLGANDVGVTLLENPNGGYLIAGDQVQPLGNYNVVVLGIDAWGNMLWNKTVTNPYNGGCKSMVKLGSEVLIVGEMATNTSSSFDIYLIKIDWQGNTIWQKTIPQTDNGDACFDAYVTQPNEVALTGYAYSTATNTTDMFMMTIDTNGNLQEEYYFHNGNFEMGYDVKPNMYGGLIVTGFANNAINGTDKFFVGLSHIGNTTFIKEKDYNALKTKVFPNPATHRLFLSHSLLKYHLGIYDSQGRTMRYTLTNQQINLTLFNKGTYLFVFTNKQGKPVYTQKIIKE